MFFEQGLYLRVEELPDGPKPLPLDSGFSTDNAYRAMGLAACSGPRDYRTNAAAEAVNPGISFMSWIVHGDSCYRSSCRKATSAQWLAGESD
tara:strand:- start:5213 stop:5488 length:276 start_codon:yes stop_codon:yes gene_type:complete